MVGKTEFELYILTYCFITFISWIWIQATPTSTPAGIPISATSNKPARSNPKDNVTKDNNTR